MFQIKFLLNKSAHTHNSGLPKCRKKVPAQIRSFCNAALRQAAKRYELIKQITQYKNANNPIKATVINVDH